MSEANLPVQSIKTLVVALTVAVSLAAVVFVTFVLPAEYNIDPTGIGGALGLTVLSSPAAELAPNVVTDSPDPGDREYETTITIPARKGLEYKFHLQQYEKLSYEWSTGEASLYFDLHGEPDGDTSGFFESYAVATNNQMRGTITVPFTGSHGWYWRNDNYEDVVVSLKAQGNYEIIGLK